MSKTYIGPVTLSGINNIYMDNVQGFTEPSEIIMSYPDFKQLRDLIIERWPYLISEDRKFKFMNAIVTPSRGIAPGWIEIII